ncbi:dihydropteroate synthase [Hydromonas duriensis]|uniref:Dihydropteroate synthase n=1 Tax=Hydromonas duriensis TaxID=1527608 RepID=A0A4R6Y0I6_9BURK|nr:dihydropteroate synthase [Hydromonas duriensis]TDR28815.1 dihydropteroate synthase [Hydromonas duriensis]
MPTPQNNNPQPSPSRIWQCGRYHLDVSRPQVMGILNITPDSFSDGGRFIEPQAALDRAYEMIEAGADIIDIGGESTRPNAQTLSVCEELCRLMPIVQALIDCGKPISIDTYKPYVMRMMLSEGVDIINDVRGFNSPVAIDAVADSNCGLCIMHMQGTPQTMQDNPTYDDVTRDVACFLKQQLTRLLDAGIAPARLCVDPGIGFGKTLAHNITLLQTLEHIQTCTQATVLVGLSRKRMIGDLTGKATDERVSGSVAAALYAVTQGAQVVRVHDVAQTVDALNVWRALSA